MKGTHQSLGRSNSEVEPASLLILLLGLRHIPQGFAMPFHPTFPIKVARAAKQLSQSARRNQGPQCLFILSLSKRVYNFLYLWS